MGNEDMKPGQAGSEQQRHIGQQPADGDRQQGQQAGREGQQGDSPRREPQAPGQQQGQQGGPAPQQGGMERRPDRGDEGGQKR